MGRLLELNKGIPNLDYILVSKYTIMLLSS